VADEVKKRRIKKSETVREKAEKKKAAPEKKPRKIQKVTDRVKKPAGKAAQIGKKEYYLPLPDNKIGRFLNKRRSPIPKFFKEAWNEVKQVNWPNGRETMKLTFAVIVFALFFGGLIAFADYWLDIIFRRILL
jgi:preprotein translocase SecE subunit